MYCFLKDIFVLFFYRSQLNKFDIVTFSENYLVFVFLPSARKAALFHQMLLAKFALQSHTKQTYQNNEECNNRAVHT